MNRSIFRLVAALAASTGLAGCVSLLPKAEPAQLYTFTSASSASAAAVAAPSAVVLRAPTSFPRAAAGDAILTRNGAETAVIAGARWAAPAAVLFDEALSSAFDASPVRLATRGEPGPSDAMLRIEVRTFEAQYRNGGGTAPTALVEARATLISLRDRNVVATRLFRAEQPASDNRTGPIVEAYDAAVDQLLDEVVGWTVQTAQQAQVTPSPTAASPR